MLRNVVVLPTYNEADNVCPLVTELLALRDVQLQVLIVDDASADGTGSLADALSAEHPGRVHVMHRAGKLGLGTAYVQGFTWALDRSADHIIQMDADFSHSPSYIPQMLRLCSTHDVVVGSRYVPGGRLDARWSLWRRLLSRWANAIWVRMSLGLRTQDTTSGFKCWRRSALERIGLDRIRSNGYVFQVEMCYAAEQLGLRILEIPICFEDRRFGHSKMTASVKIEAALRVFDIRRRHSISAPHAAKSRPRAEPNC